ncbi:ABC transporter permease [Halorubellus sp. JP-L1]|uniref:ABC transporter permease n=1 Tax=Halorubellus sp. JP-L1 TaxID=2715753 RepID=UPI00140A662A|nr:ABC transporter permease [Halorubellus sp. JP-L1]NHN41844.1 ABC transporter permease [Halorubellus sp. JP-L1]
MAPFATTVLDATIAAATPLLLGALGELINERAGILNLGMEGMMLVGALTGFAVTNVTGNPYLGLLAGAGAGLAFSLIHAVLTVSFKASQVVSGIMLSLLGIGLTDYFGAAWTAKSITGFNDVIVPVIGPVLVQVPVIGPVLFRNTVPEYIAIAFVPLVWYFLHHTNIGHEIISVGEDPATADTMGVSVVRTRYLAILLGGALAGAAGATLSLAVLKLWVGDMVAGRGWIIVALVIFAQWRSVRILLGAYLFGVLSVLQIRSQAFQFSGIDILGINLDPVLGVITNPSILATAPYVATILVLIFVSRGATRESLGAPAAFLQPYVRESE